MAKVCCKYFTVSLVPVAALFLAVLFAMGIISLPIIYTELAEKYEYGIVIDAGSSHTELYLYQFEVPINEKRRIEQISEHRDKRHLDDFVSDPSEASRLIKNLISHANESLKYIDVSDNLHKTTPIYLGATAGMRLVHMEHPNISDEIFNVSAKVIRDSSFEYKNATIITGTEEAAGGWVTANYLMRPDKGLIGSLDLGGASTEIAFAVPEGASGSSYYVNERLFAETHRIYARSYLCYGHREAHGRFLAHLIHINKNRTENVSNPCLARGTNITHTIASINTSCAVDPIATEIFGFTLPLPPHLNGNDSATFNGTGNVSQCLDEIKTVFNFSACDPEVNCESKFEYPPINGPFVGFSGFYYSARGIGIENGTFNRNNGLLKNITTTCKDLSTNLKGRLPEACFYGIFMGHVMEEGFGMKSSSNWTVVFKEKVKNKSFGWAMGYIINQTGGFTDNPYHETWPYSAVDLVIGMIVLTILCAIFVIFFFLTFYACKKVLTNNNGYHSLS